MLLELSDMGQQLLGTIPRQRTLSCDYQLPGALLSLSKHEEFQALDERACELQRRLFLIQRLMKFGQR